MMLLLLLPLPIDGCFGSAGGRGVKFVVFDRGGVEVERAEVDSEGAEEEAEEEATIIAAAGEDCMQTQQREGRAAACSSVASRVLRMICDEQGMAKESGQHLCQHLAGLPRLLCTVLPTVPRAGC